MQNLYGRCLPLMLVEIVEGIAPPGGLCSPGCVLL